MGIQRNRAVVGLELDSGVIRAVEIRRNRQNAGIAVAAGELEIPFASVSCGVVRETGAVGRALQELWRKAGFTSKRVVLGTFSRNVLLRIVFFPRVPEDKLGQALSLQADRYLPLPIEEMAMDYFILGEEEDAGGPVYEVLLAAARKQELKKNLDLLAKCGLCPLAVEAEPLALLRLLSEGKREGTVVMADLAMEESSIIVAVNGKPRFARALPLHLRQYLGDAVPTGQEAPPEISLNGYLGAAAGQIRISLDYYREQGGFGKVDRVILCGRGAVIPGLADMLEKVLEVPCETACPLETVACSDELQAILGRPEFAVSCGLALRLLEDGKW